MHKFELNDTFRAEGSETSETRIGEIYHVLRNKTGSGSVSTPIAKYFVWRPSYSEGISPHWRVDCFFKKHKLSGDPKAMSKMLVSNLQSSGLCDTPIWISWHYSAEIGGEQVGDLFGDG